MRAVFLRALLIWLLAWLLADSVEVTQIAARLSGDHAATDTDGYFPIGVRYRQQLHKEMQASFASPAWLDSPPSDFLSACTWHKLQSASQGLPPQALSRYELMSLQE
jgi:hypothetical protein